MGLFNRFIYILFLSLFAINVIAGPGFWSSSGPDGGHVFGIAADPAMPNTFYTTTRGGIYKSTDGGLAWQNINNGITLRRVFAVVHHRFISGTVYVAGIGGVYKSTDGGANWVSVNTGLPGGIRVTKMALAPLSPDTVYLGSIYNGVYKTTNGGLTWSSASTGLGTYIRALRVSPVDSNRVYAATQSIDGVAVPLPGLYETLDGGANWVDVSAAIPAPYVAGDSVSDVAFAGFGGELYITASNRVYKSSDNGVTWIHQLGVSGSAIAVNPSNSNEVIISGATGPWVTLDGGSSWTQTLAGFAGNATEVARSTVVTYDPFNPARKLAGTRSNGIYLQTLNGAPWTQQVAGLNALLIRSLAVHPGSSNRIYAGAAGALSPTFVNFISDDSGASWAQSNSGLGATHFRDIEIDPFTASIVPNTHVYAVGLDTPDTPLGGGALSDGDGGIYKSLDSGISWATIDVGIPISPGSPTFTLFGIVRDITLDLSSSVALGPVQTLYVAGTGWFSDDGVGGFSKDAARIYKSTDAGANWLPSDNGIDQPTISQFPFPAAVKIVIDPSNPLILYAATHFVGYDPSGIAPTINNGVWKSVDAGASWVHSSTGLPRVAGAGTSHFDVRSLAIDPLTPTRLYASVHDPETRASQIYKSEDAGANWVVANTGVVTTDVRDIIVDSAGVVYAAAVGDSANPGGVYRSVDFGLSWQSISIGIDSTVLVTRLEIDESGVNPILYAGTSQSVHALEIIPDVDADGVASAIEANAPNNGDGNDDGAADSEQQNVASFIAPPVDEGINFSSLSINGNYVTIEVTPVVGSCASLEDVHAVTEQNIPTDPPRPFNFGVLRFEIIDCQEASVKFIFHGATSFPANQWGIRIFAPVVSGSLAFKWQSFPATVVDNEWTLNLIDGQFGDTRPDNGRILFQGGPAFFVDAIFSDSFE